VIRRYCPPPARILDVGCGPGWSDLYLSAAGYDVRGLDSDARLADLAAGLAIRFGLTARFETGDAFDLSVHHDSFDLVYSCGVLEHFDRDVTVRLIKEQAKCAPRVLVQVPTRFTAYTGEITDERIYKVRGLHRIVVDSGLVVRSCFGYGDVTATPSQVWLRRLLPHAAYRLLQNQGFAYSIAVLGERKSISERES
jgi:SAM-dependent methyltransferase